LALTLLIYGFTVGAFTVASANFTAEIASSENLTRFMGFNSISFIIAKGLSPAVGIKLMDKYGFSVAVYGTVVVAVMAMALVFFLSDIQIDKKKDDDSNFLRVLLNRSVYLPTVVLFCGMVTFGAISAMLPLFADAKGITGTEYFFSYKHGSGGGYKAYYRQMEQSLPRAIGSCCPSGFDHFIYLNESG
jgi:predicted MFS family arabinose efflux permease